MNKNTTILIGAIVVLAIGLGAYVTMYSPSSSDESFLTQSARRGTRSLVGSSTKPASQSTPPIQAVPQPECDPAAITSTIKELSTKDINPKIPELEGGSTKTFEQCVDLNGCYGYEVKNTQTLVNKDGLIVGLFIDNEYPLGHNVSFNNPNVILSANADINRIYTTINKSGCYTFTITKPEYGYEWGDLCLRNHIEIFNFPQLEKILANNTFNGRKGPVSENIGNKYTCFNRDNPNIGEQVPNTPTAPDDGM